MKVFIENEAGSKLKHLYDEKNIEYQRTIEVAKPYLFAYRFILNTTGEDGDNIDVFVLTDKKLKTGDIVEVEVIGLMEQFEKSWDSNHHQIETNHNIIAKLIDDNQSVQFKEKVKTKLHAFVLHVFDNIRINKTTVGAFHDK